MRNRQSELRRGAAAVLAIVATLATVAPQAQNKTAAPRLTTPKQQFGHDIGDDYYLANYTQYVEYLRKLDQESDRMTVVEIGKTEEGRPELTAIITSPENHKRLAQLKENNRRLPPPPPPPPRPAPPAPQQRRDGRAR